MRSPSLSSKNGSEMNRFPSSCWSPRKTNRCASRARSVPRRSASISKNLINSSLQGIDSRAVFFPLIIALLKSKFSWMLDIFLWYYCRSLSIGGAQAPLYALLTPRYGERVSIVSPPRSGRLVRVKQLIPGYFALGGGLNSFGYPARWSYFSIYDPPNRGLRKTGLLGELIRVLFFHL